MKYGTSKVLAGILYRPRHFVLNLLGLAAFLIVIGSLANSLFGFGWTGPSIVFLVPTIAAHLEGRHMVRAHDLRPGKQAMWHVSRQMTSVYVQMVALILLLIVIPRIESPGAPDVLSPIGIFATGMAFSIFYGAVLLVVSAGYRSGAKNGKNSFWRGGM